ncbi:acyltransferase domain-containing protein [Streptomyces sp. NPDC001890]|uniref:acyltransferase domain-containing protein n=1 Tax=Streptomyces sp. NPDC001890 TaxID=3364620 RepID=UPI003694921C
MTDETPALLARRCRPPTGPAAVTVLFTGGAGIRPGLGRELYGAFPAFRAAYDTVRGALDHWLRLPLAAVVFAPEGGVDAALIRRSEFGQPALFAFHVAVFRLWQSWGLRVGAVSGHGAGEIAAAHVADALNLADAARLVTARGRLAPVHPAVLAGDFAATLDSEAAFARAAADSAVAPPRIPLVCATTGRSMGPGSAPGRQPLSPGYLLSEARRMSHTADAVRTLVRAGFPRPYPCGPDPADTRPGRELRAVLGVAGRMRALGREPG